MDGLAIITERCGHDDGAHPEPVVDLATSSCGDSFPQTRYPGGFPFVSTSAGDPPNNDDGLRNDSRPLIFCGMCGALNPASNHYCAACGTTLVDAFHATEGLRVYERPDSASRLVEIIAAGTELDIVQESQPHEDFVRVRMPNTSKLGYIRLQEVEAMSAGGPVAYSPGYAPPDINTNARGCVSPVGALGAIALVLVLIALMIVVLAKSNTYDQGTMLILGCFGLGPLLVVTVAIYLYARSRDDRLDAEEAEAREDMATVREAQMTANADTDVSTTDVAVSEE